MPLTLATAFATIAGLLADFSSERRGNNQQTIDEYLEWLRRHNHQELADGIQANLVLCESISALLRHQNDEVLAKLEELGVAINSLAGAMPQFAPIVRATGGKAILSPQSMSILKQIETHRGILIQEISNSGSLTTDYLVLGDGTEPRFIELSDSRLASDDFRQLAKLGLLSANTDDRGNPEYRITRIGSRIAQANT